MKKTSVFALLLVGTISRIGWSEPTIHVAWEETETLIPGFHYVIDTTDEGTPEFPNVELKTGSLTWRVWSTDSGNPGGIGDIGVISSPASADFGVEIRRIVDEENDAPGARNVKGIHLIPTSSANYSGISGVIAGDIEDDLVVQAISSATGAVSLSVEGELKGDVTVNNLQSLVARTVSGTISIANLTGTLRVDNLLEDGSISIQTAHAATSSGIYFTESFDGSVDIAEVANGPEAGDNLFVYLYSGISSMGNLNFHDMGTATVALFGFGPSFGDVQGTMKFWEGIGDGSQVRLYGKLMGENGVIDLNDVGIGVGAKLHLYEGGDGSIINGGIVKGNVIIGGPAEGAFTGTASFESASSSAQVILYGTGLLEFTDTFNGDLKGSVNGTDLSVNALMPSNIHMTGIGSEGRIDGTVACPSVLQADATGFSKSRFITFRTTDTRERAIRVWLTSLHHVDPPYTNSSSNPCMSCPGGTCAGCEGQFRYVGPPVQYFEHHSGQIPKHAARLQCAPHYQVWPAVVDVTGSAIIPSSQYDIEILIGDNAACASALSNVTTRWGDIVEPYSPPSQSVQPDLGDVSAVVDKFKNANSPPNKVRCILAGTDQNGRANFGIDVDYTHIAACVSAFRGNPYPYDIEACP